MSANELQGLSLRTQRAADHSAGCLSALGYRPPAPELELETTRVRLTAESTIGETRNAA